MTEPLALLLHEKLMPGSQLVNRVQDLGYRVETLHDAAALPERVEQTRPLFVLADLYSAQQQVCEAIARLKQNPATAHVVVVAYSTHNDAELHAAAREAGATLVVTEAAITHHLEQLLDQALTEFGE